MTDKLKQAIWELVEPQFEAHDRIGAHVERRLLEVKVEEVISDIEEEMEINTLNAFYDGYHDGNMEAEECISELQGQIQNVIESLRDTAYKLEREYGR